MSEALDSSMLCWWPVVKDLGQVSSMVCVPETAIYEPEQGNLNFVKWWILEPKKEKPLDVVDFENKLRAFIQEIPWARYPLFIRTDQFSGKHIFREACWIPDEEHLLPNLYNLIEYGEKVNFIGFYHRAIVIREFLELDSRFEAFGGMPVAPEYRAAVTPTSVKLYEYWPEQAIASGRKDCLPPDWRQRRKVMYDGILEDEKVELKRVAQIIQRKLGGEWSIDFAKAKNGKWYLIDMALLHESWLPDRDKKAEKKELTDAEAAKFLLPHKSPPPKGVNDE